MGCICDNMCAEENLNEIISMKMINSQGIGIKQQDKVKNCKKHERDVSTRDLNQEEMTMSHPKNNNEDKNKDKDKNDLEQKKEKEIEIQQQLQKEKIQQQQQDEVPQLNPFLVKLTQESNQEDINPTNINNNDVIIDVNNVNSPINVIRSSIKKNTEKFHDNTFFRAELLRYINKARANPRAYAEQIEENVIYIQRLNNKWVYCNGIKVHLQIGKNAFFEVSEQLRLLHTMKPLELKENLCVPVPENSEEMNDKMYLPNQIELMKERNRLRSYWSYTVCMPEIAVLLMIVSDTKSASGKKRNDLLNSDYKYIGISSVMFGKAFTSYLTFSD